MCSTKLSSKTFYTRARQDAADWLHDCMPSIFLSVSFVEAVLHMYKYDDRQIRVLLLQICFSYLLVMFIVNSVIKSVHHISQGFLSLVICSHCWIKLFYWVSKIMYPEYARSLFRLQWKAQALFIYVTAASQYSNSLAERLLFLYSNMWRNVTGALRYGLAAYWRFHLLLFWIPFCWQTLF